MGNDYEKQAEDFLSRHGLTFSAALVGSDCPRFCEDAAKAQKMDEVNKFPRKSHIHGKHYRCTIIRDNAPATAFVSDFWNSYADEEENAFAFGPWDGNKQTREWDKYRINGKYPNQHKLRKAKTPRAYDLLACIEKNDPGTFEDFCGDFGYDTDSRKAFDVYIAVQEEARKVQRFFTAAEIEELQEIS